MNKIYPPKSPVSVPEPPGRRFSHLLRSGLLIFVVLICLGMGLNPADYDPYHDNDHDTYSLLAAAIPALPQGDRDCWGSDQRCSDGKYRDRMGNEQPDNCSNAGDGPEQNNCACNRARTCPPVTPGEPAPEQDHESPDCKVYCRGDHCHCANPCESMNHNEKMPDNCPMNHA